MEIPLTRLLKTKLIIHSMFPPNWTSAHVLKKKIFLRQYLKAIDDCCNDITVSICLRNYSKKWYAAYVKAANKFRQPFIWKSHTNCVFCFVSFYFFTNVCIPEESWPVPMPNSSSCPNPFQKLHLLLENSASIIDCSFLLPQADSYNMISYSVFRNLSKMLVALSFCKCYSI